MPEPYANSGASSRLTRFLACQTRSFLFFLKAQRGYFVPQKVRVVGWAILSDTQQLASITVLVGGKVAPRKIFVFNCPMKNRTSNTDVHVYFLRANHPRIVHILGCTSFRMRTRHLTPTVPCPTFEQAAIEGVPFPSWRRGHDATKLDTEKRIDVSLRNAYMYLIR